MNTGHSAMMNTGNSSAMKKHARGIYDNMNNILVKIEASTEIASNEKNKQFIGLLKHVIRLANDIVRSPHSNAELQKQNNDLLEEHTRLMVVMKDIDINKLLQTLGFASTHFTNRVNAASANASHANSRNAMNQIRKEAYAARIEAQTEIDRPANQATVTEATTVRNLAQQVMDEIDEKKGNPRNTFDRLQRAIPFLTEKRAQSTPRGNSGAAAPSMANMNVASAMPAAAASPAAFAASATAPVAASANAPVAASAASAASAAAANAHSTTAMPVASASPAALVNASHASIPGSFPIVNPTSLAKAVSAPTPSSTHPPSMPRPPAAIHTTSSQGGRRTKRKQTNRKQTNRKQTKRTRKQTKRNRKQTNRKRNRNRNRKQTKRNRKRTHRKNK